MADRRYFPKDFDMGWIFYNDENQSVYKFRNGEIGYWEHIRRMGRDDAQRALTNFCQNFTNEALRIKMSEYAVALKNMSNIERARENKLMKEFTGEDFTSDKGKNFLRNFNEIVLGQEKFSAALKRVIAAIELGGKSRAPSQAVNFVSYFRVAFNDLLENANIETLLNDTSWNQMVDQAIDLSIERMLIEFDPEKAIFGDPKDYYGLDQYLKSNPYFYDFVRSYLKINDIRAEAQKIMNGTKKKRSKKVKINDVYKIETKDEKTGKTSLKSSELFERQIGGLVQEFLEAGTIQLNLSEQGANVISNPIKSNIGATDAITIASKTKSINFISNVEELMQEAAFGETQKQIAQHFKELDTKLSRKKYSDLFIIHASDKLYSMGDSFRGFHKEQKVTDIQGLLDKANLGGERFGHELVSLYLNTTPGAVLSDDQSKSTIRESFRVIVAAVAGKLLFSDWAMIGEEAGGASQIHIFDLDGIIIPLSYVLEGMSKAMKEFGETGVFIAPITIGSFETPKEILYPARKPNRYDYPEGEKMVDFNAYWNKQREDARQKSQFRINFMNNFKDIVINEIASSF